MNLANFATNETLEIEGVWQPIGGGARLKIARENNPKFVNLLRSKLSPYRSAAQRSALPQDESEKMMSEILAETILLDWENIEDVDENGQVISLPYSKENAFRMLQKYKEFKGLVIGLSSNVDSYREAHLAEVAENLKK